MMPHRRIWKILLQDPVALSEVLSGLFLVFLRGALLLGGPTLFPASSPDVALILQQIGVTDSRWATYLMVCGVVQIFLARTTHTVGRALVTFAILTGFVVMGAGYYQAYGWQEVPRSIICMSALYCFFLARIGIDYRQAERRRRDARA